MAARLAHRGPDGEGFFDAGALSLAHRRLAVLDLSPTGAQPMHSRDGRFTIALNGEILNYLELRRELRSELRRELGSELGGPFVSSTDTEVLLEACSAWGVEQALHRANGMFAFALWDSQEQELILARDRCGEKPLVYFWDGRTLAFSSELKALAPFHGARLDPEAVDAYLALGYVPAPLAIFRDCRKLAAGHMLRFRAGQIQIRRWWRPEAAMPLSGCREELNEELRALLSDAVRLRLRADVPVALALSGGVDSSIIAAECAASKTFPETFTVVFDSDETELACARLLASHLRLSHRVIRVPTKSVARQLALAAWHYDEPFADSSVVPALALARALAAQGIKAVLTGDGGDEAFAGYPHYENIALKQRLKAVAAAAGLCDGSGSSTRVYFESKTTFRQRGRALLLNGHGPAAGALSHLLASDEYLRHAPAGPLHQAMWSDRHFYLPNDLTLKTDIALAAYGMEGRAPFLDHRILEWSQGLASRNLVRGREKKVLLRQAYRDRLPAGLLDRPKRGFGAPIHAWLSGPLDSVIRQLLPCPLLDARAQQHHSGQRLWTLLSFAQWAQTWGARW